MKVIGGEFELHVCCGTIMQEAVDVLASSGCYSSGRSALYYILRDIRSRFGFKSVLLPEYLCSSLISAAERAGVTPAFYPLNERLEIDIAQFPVEMAATAAVLLIDYFGVIDLRPQICWLRTVLQNAVIIEDDVQACFSFVRGGDADVEYRFTSLRKSFECPDGGLVKARYQISTPMCSNTFHRYKLFGARLKAMRSADGAEDAEYLSLYAQGESRIDEEIETGMSDVGMTLARCFDYSAAADARIRNARFLVEGLRSLGMKTLVPIPQGRVPLFVPLCIENRDRVRAALARHSVFCPVHWPLGKSAVAKGAEISSRELSLVVDQRYTTEDMSRILNLLSEEVR